MAYAIMLEKNSQENRSMSFFFTKVPSQWSPTTPVKLPGGITLKPANRVQFHNYPGSGVTTYFDTLYFISQTQSVEDHIEKLKKWALFHTLILDGHICDFIESGRLQRHGQKDKIGNIRKNGAANAYVIDFNAIARQVYWLHKPTTTINYSTLYEQFEAFNEERLSLIRTYLLPIEPRTSTYRQYSLFSESRTYWQIAVYASVLEAIIGHASNCSGSDITCPVCNKRLPAHREDSEKEWRKSYFSQLITDQVIRDEYIEVINTAYNEIRHPTAHAGVMPVPQYLQLQAGTTEVYDMSRAIEQFSMDRAALFSLELSVKDITRYLLLHKLFQLNTFPRLIPLKVTRIGGGS
jgi:hypothetical protein